MSVNPLDPRWRNPRFLRLYTDSLDRLPAGNISTLFWRLCRDMDSNNLSQTTVKTLAKDLCISRMSVYRYLASLQSHGLIAKEGLNCWMIDPTIVYRGDYRYHRATRMEFGKLLGLPIAADAGRKEPSDDRDLQPPNRDPHHPHPDA